MFLLMELCQIQMIHYWKECRLCRKERKWMGSFFHCYMLQMMSEVGSGKSESDLRPPTSEFKVILVRMMTEVKGRTSGLCNNQTSDLRLPTSIVILLFPQTLQKLSKFVFPRISAWLIKFCSGY